MMRQVGRLWLELAGLLLFLAVCIQLLELKYSGYVTGADILMNHFRKHKEGASILFAGNSHTIPLTAAMDSLQQGNGGASLVFGGMDLFWTGVLVSKYMDSVPNLKTVFIGVEEELLGYNQTRFKLEYVNRSLYRYTDTLFEDTPFNRLMARSNFFRSNRDISYLVDQRNQPTDLAPMLHGIFQPGDAYSRCVRRAYENSVVRFNAGFIAENLGFLGALINRVRERGKEVILVTTPKSDCYLRERNAYTMELAASALRKFVNEKQVFYYNGNTRTNFPDSFFNDSDHLNLKGAAVFLDTLNKVLLREKGHPLF